MFGINIIQFHNKYSAKIVYFNIIPAEMDSLPSFWFECAFISFESSLLAFEKMYSVLPVVEYE